MDIAISYHPGEACRNERNTYFHLNVFSITNLTHYNIRIFPMVGNDAFLKILNTLDLGVKSPPKGNNGVV